MLIGISGKLGSGKSTLSEYIQEIDQAEYKADLKSGFTYLVEPTFWEERPYARKIKEIASLLTGIPIDNFESQDFKSTLLGPQWSYTDENGVVKPMTVRLFLQKIGTEAMKGGLHPLVWTNALYSDYDPNLSKWIVPDCRFPQEAKDIKDRGGILVRVERVYNPFPPSDHPSETALDDYEAFDYIIKNENKEDLKKAAKEILNDIKDGKWNNKLKSY